MTVATLWVAGTKYEGHGNSAEEALEALDKGWRQRCERISDADRRDECKETSSDWVAKNSDQVEYSG